MVTAKLSKAPRSLPKMRLWDLTRLSSTSSCRVFLQWLRGGHLRGESLECTQEKPGQPSLGSRPASVTLRNGNAGCSVPECQR